MTTPHQQDPSAPPPVDATLDPVSPVVAPSLYTFSIVDAPSDLQIDPVLLELNARKAIDYIEQYVRWKGELDFVVRFDQSRLLGDYWTSGGPGFGAYGRILPSGETTALHEALTGEDRNGDDYDLGLWVAPSTLKLVDYGSEIFVDPDPDPQAELPSAERRDFFSIFLHEVIHGLGMWSTDQHGKGESAFDALTYSQDGRWYFAGENAKRVNGAPVPLAVVGSRDHYSDSLPKANNLMREYGYRERWRLSNLDLAILADLGYDIIQWLSDPPAAPTDGGGGSSGPSYSGWTFSSPSSSAGSSEMSSFDQPSRVVSASSWDESSDLEPEMSPELFWLNPGLLKDESDAVIRFSAERGDRLVVAAQNFGALSRLSFRSVDDRASLRLASVSRKNFVYSKFQGVLYFNENGKSGGWGDGGSLAYLEGAPLITKQSLVLI